MNIIIHPRAVLDSIQVWGSMLLALQKLGAAQFRHVSHEWGERPLFQI
jgi:hypothetical protein